MYGECECFVMQMLYVCVLCASCGSSQCRVLHDLQYVNAGRGCNRRPYISSAIVIVRARGAIWVNPFATVLVSVCSQPLVHHIVYA